MRRAGMWMGGVWAWLRGTVSLSARIAQVEMAHKAGLALGIETGRRMLAMDLANMNRDQRRIVLRQIVAEFKEGQVVETEEPLIEVVR